MWIFTVIELSLKDSTAPLAERLFGHQYGVEMRFPEDKRSTEWVARLPAVILALNKEVTQLTGQKPVDALKKKTIPSKPSTPYLRPVGVNEKKLPSGLSVRYLYQPGELEGRRATKSYRPNLVFECLRD